MKPINTTNRITYPYKLNEEHLFEIFAKINNLSDKELNELDYEKAKKLDQRTSSQYYFSLIRTKHIFFFSFWNTFDFNSLIIKRFLFLFKFAVNLVVNAFFYNDETMHKIYIEKGKYDFIYNIPSILYSMLISGFIYTFIQLLAVTDSNLINIKLTKEKKEVQNKNKSTIKILNIKFVLFFLLVYYY